MNGKATFFGSCDACCIQTISLGVLSEFLKANPEMNAQFIIKNKSKKEADKLFKIILDKAKNDYEIARNRLTITFKNKKQSSGSDEYRSKLSDIEIWLIPKQNNGE